jgi:hypothetical protein
MDQLTASGCRLRRTDAEYNLEFGGGGLKNRF